MLMNGLFMTKWKIVNSCIGVLSAGKSGFTETSQFTNDKMVIGKKQDKGMRDSNSNSKRNSRDRVIKQ